MACVRDQDHLEKRDFHRFCDRNPFFLGLNLIEFLVRWTRKKYLCQRNPTPASLPNLKPSIPRVTKNSSKTYWNKVSKLLLKLNVGSSASKMKFSIKSFYLLKNLPVLKFKFFRKLFEGWFSKTAVNVWFYYFFTFRFVSICI